MLAYVRKDKHLLYYYYESCATSLIMTYKGC